MNTITDLLVLPSVGSIEEIVKDIPKNINLTKGRYNNLAFNFKSNEVQLLHRGKDIKQFSTVWLSSIWGSRDLAYGVNLYLDHFNTPHTFVEKTVSKITDQVTFILGGIETPDTFFIDRPDITNHVDIIEETCGYPMIIKDTKGSRGKHSICVKNRKKLLEEYPKLPKHRKYLIQRFIPNEYDWGVIVANGKVVSGEKSYPTKGEFRNNTCNGAKEIFAKTKNIPKPIQEVAIKASEALGLSWSRADIVVDKNTNIPYILEVNRYPGITSGTTEVSGAQQFLKSHLNSIKN